MGAEDITATVLLTYGAFLIWGGVTAIRVFSGLAQPVRPAHFVALHMTSVWMVGIVSAVIGLTVLYRGVGLY